MLTLQEIAEAVHATNDWQTYGEVQVTGVEFDTRRIQPGSLFVPLQGTRDGHDFIGQAFAAGAVLTLTSRPLAGDYPHLLVPDTLLAFQQLSTYYLQKVNPKVVAITGSNGKTTTKDMTASVLGTRYRTYHTQGNYNNHIGVPYTILHMAADTEMLVLEMGMDHKGEISVLSHIAQPDVAAITMIGESHIEHLGSRAGIAEAKMEITDGLKSDGLLVVPGNEPLLTPLVAACSQQVITFGGSQDVYRSRVLSEDKEQTAFAVPELSPKTYVIPVLGSYNVNNALIALIIGQHFDVTEAGIYQGLAAFKLTKNRTEWLTAANGAAILSDVYNANPTAMRLVLDTFSDLETSGRKLAVLGDMLDLGELAQPLHESIADHLMPDKIDKVYLFGTHMAYLAERLNGTFPPGAVAYFPETGKEQLIAALRQDLQPTDTVFLKASNGMGLNAVVAALIQD